MDVSWTIKKAEHQRTDGFEWRCWRRLSRVPWTARRSNQSILKEISPKCSLGGLMLMLKLQYFGHLMQRADSFEKALMLRKIEGKRRKGQLLGAALGITDKMEVWPQPPLFVPRARTRDKEVRLCDSDLFFPFLS